MSGNGLLILIGMFSIYVLAFTGITIVSAAAGSKVWMCGKCDLSWARDDYCFAHTRSRWHQLTCHPGDDGWQIAAVWHGWDRSDPAERANSDRLRPVRLPASIQLIDRMSFVPIIGFAIRVAAALRGRRARSKRDDALRRGSKEPQ